MAARDRQKIIEQHVRGILAALGEDPEREGLQQTPRRVASMYLEVFSGLYTRPPRMTLFSAPAEPNMVIVRNLPFWSMCEHHLVPFGGRADFGYIPDKMICGLSKFGRVLDYFAARPQIQEMLTNQILDHLVQKLRPQGMIVRLEAEHLCMACRGVKKAGTDTITAAYTGVFDELATRNEFYANVGIRP